MVVVTMVASVRSLTDEAVVFEVIVSATVLVAIDPTCVDEFIVCAVTWSVCVVAWVRDVMVTA